MLSSLSPSTHTNPVQENTSLSPNARTRTSQESILPPPADLEPDGGGPPAAPSRLRQSPSLRGCVWERRFPEAVPRRVIPRFPLTLNFLPRRSIVIATADAMADEGSTKSQNSPTGEELRAPQPVACPIQERDSCNLGVGNSAGRVQDLPEEPMPTPEVGAGTSPEVFVGNVPLKMPCSYSIAEAFLKSSRKTLRFIPPTTQGGEILIKPTPTMVMQGSRRWQSTAVGYFLGRRPYFPQLEAFARVNWKGLQQVSATANGFYFFQFRNLAFMEEVIEEGPWLYQGQPVVLQSWEQGMSLRRRKHIQVPVWIRIRHLPMEYWTEDGLSAVASGVGIPLYTDKITKNCLRLDFARCCSLGHTAINCLETRVKKAGVPVAVYVQKQQVKLAENSHKNDDEVEATCAHVVRDVEPGWHKSCDRAGVNVAATQTTRVQNIPSPPNPSLPFEATSTNIGKELIVYNPFALLGEPVRWSIMNTIATWNVRGLNGVAHQHAVGQLVRDKGIQFLGVLETRVRQGNIHSVRAHLLPGWSWFDDYGGPGGRIWLAWNELEVGVEILMTDEQFIHCRLLNKRTSTKCLISVVYGDCDSSRRRRLWEGLQNLAEGITEDPWCVLGDFNAIVDESESCGRRSEPTPSMAEFRDFITEAGLVHIPFTGCLYTWYNCSEGSRGLWRHLDRVLVNAIWLVLWPNTSYVCGLPCTSDHSPLILRGSVQRPTGGIFRFDNFLAKQEGFIESVRGVWHHHIHGTKMYGVVCKLKALKPIFRAQRKVKGDLTNNVSLAKAFLEKAQALFAVFNEDFFLHLVQWCRVVYCKTVEVEASMLRQRAKLKWMQYGDQCSRLFFSRINARRAKQRVFQIQSAAGLVSDSDQVAAEFVSFFQTLLGDVRRPRTLNLDFLQPHLQHTLSVDEATALLQPISHAEIRAAFFEISNDSAPGPDGYTSAFFKAAWPEIGAGLCAAVTEFFESGMLLKQINATMLVMIPKVQLPVRVSDFRPIACCNMLYKAISKIMVSRMQHVLQSLINHSQNAFVPGRSIADNVLLAQELLAGYNQIRLPPRCTIKVDIQKAYDSVNWELILESLRIFKFPPRFISWIEQCITSPMFSILLNGSMHGFFKGARGIRQGDPMSPYLFVIVMEIWHVLLKIRAQSDDCFQFHWKCQDLNILNLCFADDVLIFCAGTVNSVRTIKTALLEFADLSGLHVNPGKSTVILSKAVQRERQDILDLIGFQEGSLPIKYLGVPLVSSRLSVADCQPLIDMINKRLAGWNHLNLSLAGRTQLIKSVLSSLHMYWASAFILPKSVIKVIEGKMRAFLWKGSAPSGYAKVSWEQVCRPNEEGGLGIRSVLRMNQALMLKHVWRILQEDPHSIWVAWVLRYRLTNHTIWTCNSASASWCWKKITKISSLLTEGLLYRVGDGGKFRLWGDLWHPRGPLISTYLRGPLVTGLPADSLLSSVTYHGQWRWPSATDFDIQDIIADLPPISPQQPDAILWKSESHGMILFFGWRYWDDFLQWIKSGFNLRTLAVFFAGGRCGESHSHLLFECPFTRRCLEVLKRAVRFPWLNNGWDRDVLWASRRWRGQHMLNAANRALLASIVYHVWRERNSRRFAATAVSAESVASWAIEDVRCRIITANIRPSLQTHVLYRIWKIPWASQ
ncbi:UNVERIFIED_CONTAM: Retrovirus-related Pol polyprotein from type-2 retrotransposable element R2DM [Sesamum radiatum]|uniref:Retrovirus-related Pol polyprotein from type-2 retrotransposable element R2DM n=1 Tax=Sesamum radiatum TaxID=300843 RepID=A0AAW2JHL9_SESRA